jgi:rsbT co-antagonist protein RsbR
LQRDEQGTIDGWRGLGDLINQQEREILDDWRNEQKSVIRANYLGDEEFIEQTGSLLRAISEALKSGMGGDITAENWGSVRGILGEVSRSWAYQGLSPSETATFVLSLKKGLFDRVREQAGGDLDRAIAQTWAANTVIDKLALFTTELYQQNREEVIARQQHELLELSTPVVQLWEGIVVLPLIGTLDSARTQMVMESLLEMIVASGSTIAIIDITGVPAVDTLVAQHLLKTVAAARLMGADCIVSGISPQIAQTIVHLGVALGDVVTKATLSSAFAMALERRGLTVVSVDGEEQRA